jgi:hypothetical protein
MIISTENIMITIRAFAILSIFLPLTTLLVNVSPAMAGTNCWGAAFLAKNSTISGKYKAKVLRMSRCYPATFLADGDYMNVRNEPSTKGKIVTRVEQTTGDVDGQDGGTDVFYTETIAKMPDGYWAYGYVQKGHGIISEAVSVDKSNETKGWMKIDVSTVRQFTIPGKNDGWIRF